MAEANKDKSLYDLLTEVQHELKVGKDAWNDFSKYNYRNAETILTAVKPLLAERGLVLNTTEDVELIGTRYYVKSTVSVARGEEIMQATAFAREAEFKKGMDESQITGSATSYARKYALGGLFAIDDGNDADGQDNRETKTAKASSKAASKAPAAKPTSAPASTPKPYTDDQRKEIADLAHRLGYTDEIVEAKLSTLKTAKDTEIMLDKLNALVGVA